METALVLLHKRHRLSGTPMFQERQRLQPAAQAIKIHSRASLHSTSKQQRPYQPQGSTSPSTLSTLPN